MYLKCNVVLYIVDKLYNIYVLIIILHYKMRCIIYGTFRKYNLVVLINEVF